jgi:beta-glucanase (GH16 family)
MGNGITGPVNPLELACYSSANVTEPGDGTLHMLLDAQSNTCIGGTHPYTGAMISSNGKFQFTYGYMEFRLYLPAGSPGKIANWPAAWSFSKVNSTCCQGEDDTMEGLAGNACYHFHGSAGGPGGCASGDYTGWHTFASYWRAGVVDYYYDGAHVGQITLGITSNPQYLILDNTLMASSNTSAGPLLIPADMRVDYVRTWTPA